MNIKNCGSGSGFFDTLEDAIISWNNRPVINNVNEKVCEHKYVHQDTNCFQEYDKSHFHYIRIDTFFCEKCLDEKTKRKEISLPNKVGEKLPDWWISDKPRERR